MVYIVRAKKSQFIPTMTILEAKCDSIFVYLLEEIMLEKVTQEPLNHCFGFFFLTRHLIML
jgi:hypothetical protein